MSYHDLFQVFDVKVWLATATTWFISIADVNGILTSLATILTIGYTGYKWFLILKNKEDGSKSE